MKATIVPFTAAWIDAVAHFNHRLRDGGAGHQFYPDPTPAWLPKSDDTPVFREFFLATEGDSVRGAYTIKHEEFSVFGEVRPLASWQGPISEGTVNSDYNALGLQMVLDMNRREPLLYGLATGDPLLSMLVKLGWDVRRTPLCARVFRPARFFRRAPPLHTNAARRVVANLATFTGVGWLAVTGSNLVRTKTPTNAARAEPVDEFGDWATELFERHRSAYSFVARRDAATLCMMFPATDSRFRRFRLVDANGDVGFAVISVRHVEDDPRFGSLRVGAVVDLFAHPDAAARCVHALLPSLQSEGVDVVVSNQTHPSWVEGFRRSGYWISPNHRTFLASKKLSKLLRETDPDAAGMHLTNADGDGPIGL